MCVCIVCVSLCNICTCVHVCVNSSLGKAHTILGCLLEPMAGQVLYIHVCVFIHMCMLQCNIWTCTCTFIYMHVVLYMHIYIYACSIVHDIEL